MAMNELKRTLGHPFLSWLVRATLGVLFIWASLDKILHPDQFAKIVYSYQVLPGEVVNIFGIILPWLELICGVALIAGVMVRPAAVWIGALLVVFIIAVSIALSKGININCGCFSMSSQARQLGLTLLFQDIGMLLLAIHAAVLDNRTLSLRRAPPGR